ncbi:hypothetical protein MQE22_08570 [Acidithiobacillus sp. YTS05]|nr:hypothetical protein MQE22_08570 [Acidithiobacillus sp. YTS05]
MPSDAEMKKLLSRKRIPPRVLRQDTPGGTVWVPRWRWAGRLFGREVALPPTLGPAKASRPEAPTVAAEESNATPPQSVADVSISPPTSQHLRERWSAWAVPLLAILAVLVLVYGVGATYGYLLAVGHPPPWVSSGILGAFLDAPSGALLLLLGGLGCLLMAREEYEVRPAWLVSGTGLLLLFLLATFASLL